MINIEYKQIDIQYQPIPINTRILYYYITLLSKTIYSKNRFSKSV